MGQRNIEKLHRKSVKMFCQNILGRKMSLKEKMMVMNMFLFCKSIYITSKNVIEKNLKCFGQKCFL